MNTRSILWLSLALNVALAAAAGWVWSRPVAKKPLPAVAVTPLVTQAVATAPPPVMMNVTNAGPFHWGLVESTNYEVYVANLRAIECPPETIRDIIRAELEEAFLQKVVALAGPLRPQFWYILANMKNHEKFLEDKFEEIEKWDRERKELLEKLVGDADGEKSRRERNRWLYDRYDFLPPEQQERLVQLENELQEARQEFYGKLGQLSPEERAQKEQALTAAQEKARQEAMTAEEYDEYGLRNSSYSAIRYNTAFGGMSRDELRNVVRLQEDLEKAHPEIVNRYANSEETPEQKTERERLATETKEKLKGYLGAERFTDFQRAQDRDFQRAKEVADRFALSQETAVAVYDLRRSAMEQARELNGDGTLSAEERENRLAELVDQTQGSLTHTLGAEAAAMYGVRSGEWWMNLDQLEEQE